MALSWGPKRGRCVGKTKQGNGTKRTTEADRHRLPIAICAANASPHEVILVGAALGKLIVNAVPEHLIGDETDGSGPLDERLAEWGIAMIAPHRANRKEPKTQDGRPLRLDKRRWKIEQFFERRGYFRRLVVHYERHMGNYLGFVHPGCILILLRLTYEMAWL